MDLTTTAALDRINKSGISEAFTPSTPVNHNFFCGRTKEVKRILLSVVSSRNHILLYGDRGVGKTSLAKYTCELLVREGYKERFIEARCGKDDTFGSVIQNILYAIGIEYPTNRTTTTTTSASVKVLEGSRSTVTETATYIDYSSPAWAAERMKDINAIILIDEFDTLRAKDDKEKFAQLIKLLSDSHSACTLMIVGISLSAAVLL